MFFEQTWINVLPETKTSQKWSYSSETTGHPASIQKMKTTLITVRSGACFNVRSSWNWSRDENNLWQCQDMIHDSQSDSLSVAVLWDHLHMWNTRKQYLLHQASSSVWRNLITLGNKPVRLTTPDFASECTNSNWSVLLMTGWRGAGSRRRETLGGEALRGPLWGIYKWPKNKLNDFTLGFKHEEEKIYKNLLRELSFQREVQIGLSSWSVTRVYFYR